MSRTLNLIFACWGDGCRSQMAEDWSRHLHPDALNPFFAGIEPKPHVDPLAVRAMKETGVDIAYQKTHRVSAFLTHDIGAAIPDCDEAATHVLHRGARRDPSRCRAAPRAAWLRRSGRPARHGLRHPTEYR